MIKVLVVDDSPVFRELLSYVLTSDPEIKVIGTASNGEEALKAIQQDKPDVITMDIIMPGMDGFETTRKIMETNPVPIIIVTGSLNIREIGLSFKTTEAGALTIVQKPRGIGHPGYEKDAKELIRMVKLMSEVTMVKRWTDKRKEALISGKSIEADKTSNGIKIVAIGASTGGPPVVRKILSGLPKNFSLPVLIVQHMSAGFIAGFAEWLNHTSALPVHVAVHNTEALGGHVYIAPDGVQMRVAVNGRVALAGDPPENGLRPSVSYLFRSVANAYGSQAIGILLTGMGKDGAAELKLMREKGAVTIAQNRESSVVFGMPGEAVKIDAARYILSLEGILSLLTSLG
jgi:two-component system, chemotaxis family, protein-glutamate methylesterase/glutaminase